MSRLELILIFVLQFEAGVGVEFIFLYDRPGRDVTLSCGRASASDTACSNTDWLFNREPSLTLSDVKEGKVQKSSGRADRLSLGADCSLVINSVAAEDAGRFTCRQKGSTDQDVYLSLLRISPSPPDADPERDGEVTLVCSLSTYSKISHCQQNSIRWVDETRTVLDGEGVGYKFLGQKDCDSSLTVTRQRGNNRTYTCQFVDKDNNVKVETDYTAVFSGAKRDDQPGKSNADSTVWPLSSIMLALRITGLILMTVITVLLIRDGMKTKPCDDDNDVQKDGDEVTYENVDAGPAAVRLH